MEQHPCPKQREDGDCDEVGGAADEMSERVPGEQADDRHCHFEAGHDQADPEALTAREPAHAERGGDGERVQSERQDEEDQLEHSRSRLIVHS